MHNLMERLKQRSIKNSHISNPRAIRALPLLGADQIWLDKPPPMRGEASARREGEGGEGRAATDLAAGLRGGGGGGSGGGLGLVVVGVGTGAGGQGRVGGDGGGRHEQVTVPVAAGHRD